LSRGVWRIFAVALGQYQRTLDARALLDFSGVLERAVKLLKDMDEFAQSRFRLEARYRHVLVDEFQDINLTQAEILYLITGPQRNYMAIGDEDAASNQPSRGHSPRELCVCVARRLRFDPRRKRQRFHRERPCGFNPGTP